MAKPDSVHELNTDPSAVSIISSKSSGSTYSRSIKSSRSAVDLKEDERRFVWHSQGQHILYFIAYISTWKNLSGYLVEDQIFAPDFQPSFYHTIITFVIFGGPLLFLETFLGQYTQRGCIFLGAQLPLAYGFGYCLLANTFIDGVGNLYLLSLILFYVLVSVLNYPTPPWMLCLKDYYEFFPCCFSRRNIEQKCKPCYERRDPKIPNEICYDLSADNLSAKIFMQLKAFGESINSKPGDPLGNPQLQQCCHLFITSLLVYFFASKKFKNLDWVVRYGLIFSLIAYVSTIVVFLFFKGSYVGLVYFFEVDFRSFFSLSTWLASFRRVVTGLSVCQGGHMLFGSFLPSTTAVHFRVCYLVVAELAVIAMFLIHVDFAKVILACSLNIRVSELPIFTGNDIAFILYPEVFGILAASQLWGTIYIMSLFVFALQTITMQIIVIEESISQEFDQSAYYIYTRFAVCFAMSLCALAYTTPRGFDIWRMISFHRTLFLMLLITIQFAIIMSYTFERLSDDINFLSTYVPSAYLKICWFLTPVFSVTSLAYFYGKEHNLDFYRPSLYVFLLACSPLLIGLIIKIYKYLKLKNLTGLLKATDKWGPPDNEMILMRHLYNPRFEVRYRRRLSICKHHCLINSMAVNKALELELGLLNRFLMEIEENEEERTAREDVLSVLRRQRTFLADYVSLRKPTQI